MTPIQKAFYDAIELTKEEKEAALLNARIKKYFHERNRQYWESLEKVVPNKAHETPVQAVKNVLQKRSKERWGKAFKVKKKRT